MPVHQLTIAGMHCAGCVGRIEQSLLGVIGVQSARVTRSPPTATVEGDAPVNALIEAVARAGSYVASPVQVFAPAAPDGDVEPPRPESLKPLFLIVGFLTGVVFLATFARGSGSWHAFMLDWMGGFFVVFSFFKMLDLPGFVRSFAMYDLLAGRSRAYAWAYPFLELALGVGYLLRWHLTLLHAVTLGLMLIGAAGVLRALRQRTRIRCACLGTALNMPMTTVTLVEDLAMAGMALAMLLA